MNRCDWPWKLQPNAGSVNERIAGRCVLVAATAPRASELRLRTTPTAWAHVETRLVARFRRGRGGLDQQWLITAARLLLRHSDRRSDEGRETAGRLLLGHWWPLITDIAGLFTELAWLAILAIAIAKAAVVVVARLTFLTLSILASAVLAIAVLAIAVLNVSILAAAILRGPVRSVAVVCAPIGITAIGPVPIVNTAILACSVLASILAVSVLALMVSLLAAAILVAAVAVVIASILGAILSVEVLALATLPLGTLAVLAALTVAVLIRLPVIAVVALATLRLTIAVGLAGRERRRRHDSFAGRSETVGKAGEIVVRVVFLRLDLFARLTLVSELSLLLRLLRGSDQSEVVLRVLQVTFRHDRIAGRLSIARELQILFADMMGGAPDLYVRPIRLVGARKRIWTFSIIVVVASTHTLVLTRSHR